MIYDGEDISDTIFCYDYDYVCCGMLGNDFDAEPEKEIRVDILFFQMDRREWIDDFMTYRKRILFFHAKILQ